MSQSPYAAKPTNEWKEITEKLIATYPLSQDEILEIAVMSWKRLWESKIGGEIKLNEVDLPATVVGYFFQKLFAYELSKRYPSVWKGEVLKSDKDLVNINNPSFSTEMKTSGQLGYNLYGNRSYNQQTENSENSGKDKSGYYITLNFYEQAITSLRIGWIDQDDWLPQDSQTGQAATLKTEVYDYKLLQINGAYLNDSPVQLLKGIGDKVLTKFHGDNVYTFSDLRSYAGENRKILKIKSDNLTLLNSFLDF